MTLTDLANPTKRCRCPRCGGTVVREPLAGNGCERVRASCAYCEWSIYLRNDNGWREDRNGNGIASDGDEVYAEGLSRRQYDRWVKCGRPDVDSYIAAGCPTVFWWKRKLEEAK